VRESTLCQPAVRDGALQFTVPDALQSAVCLDVACALQWL
jgi:hypothetical protein